MHIALILCLNLLSLTYGLDQLDLPARQKLAESSEKETKSLKVIELLAPYANEISEDSLQRLARAYREQKDYVNEVKTLEMYLRRKPNSFRPHYLIGLALRDAKELSLAVENLRKSLELAPKHQPSYQALYEIFKSSGQKYESRILLGDMIKRFGEKSEYLNDMCRLLIDDGFLGQAQNTCKNAIKKDPRFPDNHVHYAQSYLFQNNKKVAEKIFITAGRQFPKSEYVQWSVGEYYFQEGNFPTAARYLKAAVEADGDKARSRLGLALTLFELQKPELAQDHYLKACTLDKSREALTAFKTAAAKLRQQRNPLAAKYELSMGKCY